MNFKLCKFSQNDKSKFYNDLTYVPIKDFFGESNEICLQILLERE